VRLLHDTRVWRAGSCAFAHRDSFDRHACGRSANSRRCRWWRKSPSSPTSAAPRSG